MNFILEYRDYNTGYRTSWEGAYGKGKISLKELNNYLDDNKVPVKRVDPKSIKKYLLKADMYSKRIEDSNLDFPIILIEKGGKIVCLLDGHHRLSKCLLNNCKFIKTRTLNIDNAPEKYHKIFQFYFNRHRIPYGY